MTLQFKIKYYVNQRVMIKTNAKFVFLLLSWFLYLIRLVLPLVDFSHQLNIIETVSGTLSQLVD